MAMLDALVVGGGPSGATAALRLARAGWQVAVVERARFPRRKVCGEFVSATAWPLLRELGLAPKLLALAGPAVREVGFFARDVVLAAPMPLFAHDEDGCGRALGREHLDTALLEAAREAGAALWQPWSVESIEPIRGGHRCTLVAKRAGQSGSTFETAALDARVVVAAHGSWERGALPTQCRQPTQPSDLLAFKAHFRAARLRAGRMPLLVFPGGYGGMVETDRGRVSLSCCIRRDALARARAGQRGSNARSSAGEAVLAHIVDSCRGVREVLAGAQIDGNWLSAGPIRPGARRLRHARLFPVGNAAGEAHPIVAEGIAMAIESAWLACNVLLAHRSEVLGASSTGSAKLVHLYESLWHANFARRISAAALFAGLATHSPGPSLMSRSARLAPALLTLGARLSGKARALKGMPRGEASAFGEARG